MKTTANIFKALADPTRRQILQELKKGELTAGSIASLFEITGPSISRHLAILKNADLLTERKEGNKIYYRLQADQLAICLNTFLSQVCPTQMSQRKRISKKKGKSK